MFQTQLSNPFSNCVVRMAHGVNRGGVEVGLRASLTAKACHFFYTTVSDCCLIWVLCVIGE